MGRGSEPKHPSYAYGELRYGDALLGKTYRDPQTGNLVNQYTPDPFEEQRRALVQSKMNDIISNFGTVSPSKASMYDALEKNFITDATQKYMQEYLPTVQSLKEDIASRFGTLNSSNFLDRLDSLENNKSNAFADIINKGLSYKNELINQDESSRLNQLKALSAILSQDNGNLIDALNVPMSSAKNMSEFLNQQYVEQLKTYRAQQQAKSELMGKLISGAFKVGAAL